MKFKTTAAVFLLILTCFISNAYSEVTVHDFFGAWLNVDANTEGMTRTLISPGTLRNHLDIQSYGKCHPIDCQWEEKTIIYPGNGFQVVYTYGITTKTQTFTYIEKGDTLHVNELLVVTGHSTKEFDFYFTRMTEPDLVVREILRPTTVITEDEEPWVWYTFRVYNLGVSWTASGDEELYAKIVEATKDGQPYTNVGYFDLSANTSIEMGDYVEHKFAVSTWNPGHYILKIMVDHDDLIPEADDKNNISYQIAFTVLPEHQLSGMCRFNNSPLWYFTPGTPDINFWDSNTDPVPAINNYYYPGSSLYAVENIPENEDMTLWADLHITGSFYSLPGNYRSLSQHFNLSEMTPEEKENFHIDFYQIMHMTSPYDNANIELNAGQYPVYQPGILFEWDTVTGATEYELELEIFRDSDHPAGYGRISIEPTVTTIEPRHILILPVSNPQEHYEVKIKAKNSSGEMIGEYYTTYIGNIWSVSFRFKVDYNCYPDLPNPSLHVTSTEEFEVGGNFFTRYHLYFSNWTEIPAELFAPAPDLAPCGLNINSPRTWVSIYDIDGNPLKTFCSVGSPAGLNNLWFAVPLGDPPPDAVYAELNDRRCRIIYRSTIADTSYPCPLADLNDDCMVNLLDLAIMGSEWLYGTTP